MPAIADAPVVVLAHGFPELAYSWRHQIPALAEAGYRVLAPDQRGYGGSSKPAAVDAYDIVELSADIVGLLDDVGAERAVLVGHDFGGVVAWSAPLLHPDRFAGVVGLSVPPVPAAEGADDAGVPQGLRRQLLLHPLLPGARTRRRRTEPRPGHHAAQADGLADDHRRGRGAAHAATRPGGIHRPPTGAGRAARLDQPGRVRPLRHGIHQQRFHRAAELVPLLRPQLGTDRDDAGRDDRCAVAVHRRSRRPDAGLHAAPPRSRGGLRRLPRSDDRRRGPLAAAGAARRGQRRRCSTSCPDWSCRWTVQ